MTWKLEYDEAADETVIRWDGPNSTAERTVSGELSAWVGGLPKEQTARDAIHNIISSASSSEQTTMLLGLHYGFDRQ